MATPGVGPLLKPLNSPNPNLAVDEDLFCCKDVVELDIPAWFTKSLSDFEDLQTQLQKKRDVERAEKQQFEQERSYEKFVNLMEFDKNT